MDFITILHHGNDEEASTSNFRPQRQFKSSILGANSAMKPE